MAFIETPRFPERILLGATFSPRWATDVTVYGSGVEARNANWLYPLVSAELPFTDELSTIEDVRDWFMAARGRLNGFRVKDPSDYKSCDVAATISATDQVIGTGDDTTSQFQLIKNYTIGTETGVRQIKKPVAGTVVVALDGIETTDFSVDTTTGIVTFGSPTPASGVEITAGFQFDIPMRFDLDALPVQFISPQVLAISQIPMVELRL